MFNALLSHVDFFFIINCFKTFVHECCQSVKWFGCKLFAKVISKERVKIIGPVKQKEMRIISIIFLCISLHMCFGCSKEPSHRDGSFEHPQHMFWLRNKKNNFQLRTLIWGFVKSIRKSPLILHLAKFQHH